jgi:hypothetical protein
MLGHIKKLSKDKNEQPTTTKKVTFSVGLMKNTNSESQGNTR